MKPKTRLIAFFFLTVLLLTLLACRLLGGLSQKLPIPAAKATVFASDLGKLYGLAFDPSGHLYAVGTDGDRSVLWKITPDGQKESFAQIVDQGDVLSDGGLAAHSRSLANVAVDDYGHVWLTSNKHGAGFVVSPDRKVTKFYLNGQLSISLDKERSPEGVAWDGGTRRLYLITSGPTSDYSYDNKNFIATLTVSPEPGVFAAEMIAVTDSAGNKVKAINNAGLLLEKSGNGLMIGPGSILYFIGLDALYEVRSGGDLKQFGETFEKENLWGGAADNEGYLYLSSNVKTYDPEQGSEGQGIVWRLDSQGKRVVYVEGVAEPMGLAFRHGFLYIADRATGRILKVSAGKATGEEPVAQNISSSPTMAPPAATATPTPAEVVLLETATPASTAPPVPTPTPTPTTAPPPEAVSAWARNLGQVKLLAYSEEQRGKDLAWAPDGRMIAVAAQDLHFFIPGVDQEVRQIEGLQWVNSVAYSPDGKILAWSNYAGLTLWDVATGDDIQTFESLKEASQLVFSHDGTLLAAAPSSAQKVVLLEVATGREVRTFTSDCCSPDAIAFSPDGKTLAWGADEVCLWDVQSGQQLRELTEHTLAVTSVAFSPDGKILASGSLDQAINLYDPADGRLLRTLTGHTDTINKITFSPEGRLLASASRDRTIKIWDVVTGQELRTLTGHTDWVNTVAFSPDGTMLASGGEDSALRLWGPPTAAAAVPAPAPSPTPLPATIQVETKALLESEWANQVAWSPDGKLLAIDTYRINLYDAQSLKQVYSIDSVQWANSIDFSPDSRMLVAASHDGIKVWDTAGWGELYSFPGGGDAQNVAWSPDGALLAVSIQQAVKVIDLASGEDRFTLNTGGYASYPAFSPDGRILAALGSGALKMWDVASGQELRLPAKLREDGSNTALAFSPDGQTLATASFDKTIRLWETKNWSYRHTLSGHTGDIHTLAFSPDSRWLASGSQDLTVRLWDAATGQGTSVLTGHTNRINSVAFSPDGTLLASGATDQAVRIWNLGGSPQAPASPPAPAASSPAPSPQSAPAASSPTPSPQPTIASSPPAPSLQPTPAVSPPTPSPQPPPANCPDPRVVITSPANGATIRGIVPFMGTANLVNQISYKFEYKPAHSPTWQFLTNFDGKTVANDKLMDFYSDTIAPGVYDFRLIAIDQTGNYPPPCEIQVTVER